MIAIALLLVAAACWILFRLWDDDWLDADCADACNQGRLPCPPNCPKYQSKEKTP